MILKLLFIAQRNRYKQLKSCKKDISQELMALAWYPRKWWDWCMSEDEKKKGIEPFLIDGK